MSFKDILGHDKEMAALKNAILNSRVAHAFIFSGPDGIGKRLAALEFARALNCEGFNGDSCGVCASCRMMDAGTHPNILQVWPTVKEREDLLENAYDGAGLIRISQIRDIQEFLRYRIDGGKKAVVVDYAERLMPQAANAFLKTLEEPPPGSVIMLITSRPSDLLPTILSRCQRINFRPLPDDAVSAVLVSERGVEKGAAQAVARLSCGSISKALRYVDEGAHESRREILRRLTALAAADTDELLKFAEDLSKMDGLPEMLEFMKGWYRDRLVTREGAGHLVVNGDISDFIAQGGDEDAAILLGSFAAIEKARRDITPPRYLNKQLVMEVLLMRLSGRGGLYS
ncbi:MAG: DNA polymerase III subunit delta' [Deltaproteobacteria bacterium]|nr:DNA polymerase III subunit delta' [Deltaproteobacteria bacterium]